MDGGDYSSLSGQAHDYELLRSGGSFAVPIEPFEVEHSKEASQSGRDSGLNSSDLMFGENRRWQPPADLDSFFQKVYLYYCEKGFLCMVTQWVVELSTLGFTIAFSAFLLLWVNWPGLLSAKCGMAATEESVPPCDLSLQALYAHPLQPLTLPRLLVLGYLLIFSCYWIFSFLRFFLQLKELLTVRDFVHNSLGVSESELQSMAWPSLVDKMVLLQSRKRLCIARDLSAHDMVSRVMRKENYLIGMLNKGVLATRVPHWLPGTAAACGGEAAAAGERLLLTKTLEWTLHWCILHHMFDENFLVRREFLKDPQELRTRLRLVAVVMLLLSPFLSVFMLIYFFLRNAEQFYHQPSSAGSRRWSNLALWKFREFNELDHLFKQRVNASYKEAVEYTNQFPSPLTSMIAKFVAFVAGSFAAVLLGIALMDETLLEAHILGRNLFWYAAILGTVVAVSRSLVTEEHGVFDPHAVMVRTVNHTHYLPKHWRGAAATDGVRAEFEALFQLKAVLFLEEVVSILVTPCLLCFYLPQNADRLVQFVREFTVHVEGVGHVCSLSVFDFSSHGNSNYASPCHVSKGHRSSQGKMEKSFLGFKSQYPNWQPDANGVLFLSRIAHLEQSQCGAAFPPPLHGASQQLNATWQPPAFSLSNSYPFPHAAIATPRPSPHIPLDCTGGMLSPSPFPPTCYEPPPGYGPAGDSTLSEGGSASVSTDHSDVRPLRPMRARHLAVPDAGEESVDYEAVHQFLWLDKYNTAASTESVYGSPGDGEGGEGGGGDTHPVTTSEGTEDGLRVGEGHMDGVWGGYWDSGVAAEGEEEMGEEVEEEREWVSRRQACGGTIHQRLTSAGAIALPGLTMEGKWGEEGGRRSPPLLFGDVYDQTSGSAKG